MFGSIEKGKKHNNALCIDIIIFKWPMVFDKLMMKTSNFMKKFSINTTSNSKH
jgi:hypothetical protein